MSDEEKKEYEELKSLLYTGTISQYGKRKLIDIIEKQSKEIEELKEDNKLLQENYSSAHEDINWFCENYISKDKIKAKIEEYEKEIQIRKNVINNDVLDKQTIEKARIEWACMEDFIYEMQSLLEKEE